jgi:hypothetical protein
MGEPPAHGCFELNGSSAVRMMAATRVVVLIINCDGATTRYDLTVSGGGMNLINT